MPFLSILFKLYNWIVCLQTTTSKRSMRVGQKGMSKSNRIWGLPQNVFFKKNMWECGTKRSDRISRLLASLTFSSTSQIVFPTHSSLLFSWKKVWYIFNKITIWFRWAENEASTPLRPCFGCLPKLAQKYIVDFLFATENLMQVWWFAQPAGMDWPDWAHSEGTDFFCKFGDSRLEWQNQRRTIWGQDCVEMAEAVTLSTNGLKIVLVFWWVVFILFSKHIF